MTREVIELSRQPAESRSSRTRTDYRALSKGGTVHWSRSDRWFAVLLAITVFAGAVSGMSSVIADTELADPYIDQLAEAADTPSLSWADCGDGCICATAAVPLNYHHPQDEQIDLAVIKLPAA